MTTNAAIGLGSEFWLDNASGTLTQVGEILTVTPPNPQTAEVEATHMTTQEITGECIVKGWVPTDPIDNRMTATLTVRYTSTPSYAHV
jgi:hypothetical protein